VTAAVLTVGVLLAACSSSGRDGGDDGDNGDGSQVTGQASEPTAAPGGDSAEGAAIDLETAAEAPVDQIDFDALYRALDAVRVEADAAEDATLLATVSSDAARLARIAAEAADTDTSWDASRRSYTVDSVEVFDVVDEDRVLLSVIDTVTGTRYKLDGDGEVVDERTREEPSLRFLVLVERSSGTWKIAYDVFGLPATIPLPAFADFAPVVSVAVEGVEVQLSVARNDESLTCFLVAAPGQAPQVGCAFDSRDEQASLFLFRGADDAFEAVVALHSSGTGEAVGVVEPVLTVAMDRKVGTWHYGFGAAEAGVMQSFSWTGVTAAEADEPVDLDGLRARLRPGEPVLS
jgi:hypothetical protein